MLIMWLDTGFAICRGVQAVRKPAGRTKDGRYDIVRSVTSMSSADCNGPFVAYRKPCTSISRMISAQSLATDAAKLAAL
jgi:hypothetical protein